MSRIGNAPIALPAGVTVTVAENNFVTVKGPKGTLSQNLNPNMVITVGATEITVARTSEEKEIKSLHGLTRALLNNMVVGVTSGYEKKLEIVGVGYKVVKTGKTLQLFLGHSLVPGKAVPQARFCVDETDAIKFDVPDANTIIVKGIDKQAVGQMAAVIRGKRPPEPYHGKGVKYADEYIRRKAGKAGGKKK